MRYFAIAICRCVPIFPTARNVLPLPPVAATIGGTMARQLTRDEAEKLLAFLRPKLTYLWRVVDG